MAAPSAKPVGLKNMDPVVSVISEGAFNVFTALRTSSKVIHDDTQIEKFLSWVQCAVKSQDAADVFLSNAEVISLFSYAARSDIEEPFQVLIIALRLGPSLLLTSSAVRNVPQYNDMRTISSEGIFPPWLEVFKAAQRKEPWADPSVRNAWVLGLDSMCSSQPGIIWCLKKGLLNTVEELLSDESIFVINQAKKLILRILPILIASFNRTDRLDTDIFKNYQNLKINICKAVRAHLARTNKDYNSTGVETSLDLLQGICENPIFEKSDFHAKLTYDDELVRDLLAMLENQRLCQQRRMVVEIVTTLHDVLHVRKRDETSDLLREVEEHSLHLLGNAQIYPAMVLASRLVNSQTCQNTQLLQEISILPLMLITGRPCVAVTTTAVEGVQGALGSTSAIVDATIHMLRIVRTVENLDSAGFMTDVLKLFNISLGSDRHSVVSEARCDEKMNLLKDKMVKAVINHNKIHLSLLELFIKLNQKVEIQDQAMKLAVIQGCLQLLERQGIPSQLSNKAYECIWIHVLSVASCALEPETSLSMKRTLEALGERIKMGLCDIAWEVRDSSVEMIGKLVHDLPDGSLMYSWLMSESLVEQVWLSIEDGQSYVRAAALNALTVIPARPSLWQQLLKVVSEDELLDKVSSIVRTDTEAFARRASVQLLCDWASCTTLAHHRSFIISTVNAAITDLDWEVKTTVLNYWSTVIDNMMVEKPDLLPDHAKVIAKSGDHKDTSDSFRSELQKINSDGGLQCLLYGLTDYDQCVQCKACRIIIKFRTLSLNNGLCGTDSGEPSMKKAKLESPAVSGWFDKLLQDESLNWRKGVTPEMFIRILDLINFDEVMNELSESTDDYVKNPESLFDDILTSLGNEDNEDNAIDCY